MPNALVLANPFSARFARPVHRRVVRIMSRHWDVESVFPTEGAHGTDLAARAAKDGIDMVVAMGGDGVVHHVAQGLIGTETSIGVIPTGTADVFGRQIGCSLRPETAAKRLLPTSRVEPKPVLTFEATNDAEIVHRSAVFSLGVGADAAIVEAAEAAPLGKQGFGPLHFAATAVREVRNELAHDATRMTVQCHDRSARPIGVMAQFRESYTYFGRFPMRVTAVPPAPMSLLIVNEMRVRRTLTMISAAIGEAGLGAVNGMDLWNSITQFSVDAEGPVPVQADGEVIGRFDRVAALLLEDVLLVRLPSA